jgi:hypothetical protein
MNLPEHIGRESIVLWKLVNKGEGHYQYRAQSETSIASLKESMQKGWDESAGSMYVVRQSDGIIAVIDGGNRVKAANDLRSGGNALYAGELMVDCFVFDGGLEKEIYHLLGMKRNTLVESHVSSSTMDCVKVLRTVMSTKSAQFRGPGVKSDGSAFDSSEFWEILDLDSAKVNEVNRPV